MKVSSSKKKKRKIFLTINKKPQKSFNNIILSRNEPQKIKISSPSKGKNKILNKRKSKINTSYEKKKSISNIAFKGDVLRRSILKQIGDNSERTMQITKKLGEGFRTYKLSISNEKNPLNSIISNNILNINIKRSRLVAKRLKNLEKMNEQYDYEYYKSYNLDYDKNENNNENEKDINEKKKKENYLSPGERAIKEEEEDNKFVHKFEKFEGYRTKKKLENLKTVIDFMDKKDNLGFDEGRMKKHNNLLALNLDRIKSLSFIRPRKKFESNYIPSINYNKNNLFFDKKYTLIQDNFKRNSISNQYISSIPLQNKLTKKIHINTTENSNSSIKSNNTSQQNLVTFSNFSCDGNNITTNNSKNTLFTPENRKNKSQKHRRIFSSPNSSSIKKYNTTKNSGIYYDDYTKNRNLISHINSKNKKQIMPMLIKLIKNGSELKRDININNYFYKDTPMTYKNKSVPKNYYKNQIDIPNIRKEMHLYNVSEIIDEKKIIMNNVHKMSKSIHKKEMEILLNVAKTVIREDQLTHNFVYYNDSLENKMAYFRDKKKLKTMANKAFCAKARLEKFKKNKKTDEQKLHKLMKNDKPNFNNIKSLEGMIYKYKTMKFDPHKV